MWQSQFENRALLRWEASKSAIPIGQKCANAIFHLARGQIGLEHGCSRGRTDFLSFLAAFSLTLAIVARDQQERMLVAIGEQPQAGNLSPFIDGQGKGQQHAGTGRNEEVQVDQRAFFPKKCVCVPSAAIVVG